MSRPRLLITESRDFSPEALELLRSWADVRVADCDREELLRLATSADIAWVRLRHRLDAEFFAAAPELRIVVSPTTGLNHIDLARAASRGVEVLSLQGEAEFLKDVRATAELTIALMLSLLRRLPRAFEHASSGHWNRDLFKGGELCDRTVGLVGCGRLGTLVARYLKAFDARVLVSDPHITVSQVPSGCELVALETLLTQSSIVSLHVNLCESTVGMFDESCFHRMRTGSLFINTARGELVDETALLAALTSGQLAGAALDVLCDERSTGMSDHPLVKYAARHDHLLLTPHLGGCTSESMAKTELFMARKLTQAYLALLTTQTTP